VVLVPEKFDMAEKSGKSKESKESEKFGKLKGRVEKSEEFDRERDLMRQS
jgi:hypothetical protein